MKLQNTEVKTVYDSDGNVTGSSVVGTGIFRIQVEEYHRSYHDNLSWLDSVKSLVAVKIFYYLCGMISFNQNVVTITSQHNRRILEKYDITKVTLYKALRELQSLQAICRISELNSKTNRYEPRRGEYFVNPAMIWVGSDTDRANAIKSFYEHIDNLKNNENDRTEEPEEL